MNRFVSEEALKTEADRIASMTKAEREWEIARSTDIGAGIASSSTATNGASGPSLYDQLRAKDEENATEEEDRQKGLQMPQTLDEDEVRYFNEQKLKEREEDRRLERQVDSFKKAAALASANHKSEPTLLSVIKPRSDTTSITKKISPIAKISAVKPVPSSTASTAPKAEDSKKRLNADLEKNAPATKKPTLEDTSAIPASATAPKPATPKIGLVKYNRNDDDE